MQHSAGVDELSTLTVEAVRDELESEIIDLTTQLAAARRLVKETEQREAGTAADYEARIANLQRNGATHEKSHELSTDPQAQALVRKLREVFDLCSSATTGVLNKLALAVACQRMTDVAAFFHLHEKVQPGDGNHREAFEWFFQQLDELATQSGGNGTLTWEAFQIFYARRLVELQASGELSKEEEELLQHPTWYGVCRGVREDQVYLQHLHSSRVASTPERWAAALTIQRAFRMWRRRFRYRVKAEQIGARLPPSKKAKNKSDRFLKQPQESDKPRLQGSRDASKEHFPKNKENADECDSPQEPVELEVLEEQVEIFSNKEQKWCPGIIVRSEDDSKVIALYCVNNRRVTKTLHRDHKNIRRPICSQRQVIEATGAELREGDDKITRKEQEYLGNAVRPEDIDAMLCDTSWQMRARGLMQLAVRGNAVLAAPYANRALADAHPAIREMALQLNMALPPFERNCLVTIDGKQLDSHGRPVPPTHWGITKQQIHTFYERHKLHPTWKTMTARDLVQEIICPTYRSGKSVSLSLNDSEPVPIEMLISHSWDENIDDFFQDVMTIPVPETVGLFICFLSLYQGTKEEVHLQVTQGSCNIDDGCFSQILSHVRKQPNPAMIIMPNDALKRNGQGLYSRLWCSWEVYNACVCGISMQFWPPSKATPEYLFGDCSKDTFKVQNGHCGPPGTWPNMDEDQIRTAVAQNFSWDRINDLLIKGFVGKGLANMTWDTQPPLELRYELGESLFGEWSQALKSMREALRREARSDSQWKTRQAVDEKTAALQEAARARDEVLGAIAELTEDYAETGAKATHADVMSKIDELIEERLAEQRARFEEQLLLQERAMQTKLENMLRPLESGLRNDGTQALLFSVVLTKTADMKSLGLRLNNETLQITMVRDGLVKLYNDSANAESQVRKGDHIVEVNGCSGNVELMLGVLRGDSKELKLLIRRNMVETLPVVTPTLESPQLHPIDSPSQSSDIPHQSARVPADSKDDAPLQEIASSPALRALASAVFASHANADVAFEAFDSDGGGRVRIQEFRAGVQALFPVKFQGDVDSAFRELVESDTGIVMRKHFKALAKIFADMMQEDDGFIYIDEESEHHSHMVDDASRHRKPVSSRFLEVSRTLSKRRSHTPVESQCPKVCSPDSPETLTLGQSDTELPLPAPKALPLDIKEAVIGAPPLDIKASAKMDFASFHEPRPSTSTAPPPPLPWGDIFAVPPSTASGVSTTRNTLWSTLGKSFHQAEAHEEAAHRFVKQLTDPYLRSPPTSEILTEARDSPIHTSRSLSQSHVVPNAESSCLDNQCKSEEEQGSSSSRQDDETCDKSVREGSSDNIGRYPDKLEPDVDPTLDSSQQVNESRLLEEQVCNDELPDKASKAEDEESYDDEFEDDFEDESGTSERGTEVGSVVGSILSRRAISARSVASIESRATTSMTSMASTDTRSVVADTKSVSSKHKRKGSKESTSSKRSTSSKHKRKGSKESTDELEHANDSRGFHAEDVHDRCDFESCHTESIATSMASSFTEEFTKAQSGTTTLEQRNEACDLIECPLTGIDPKLDPHHVQSQATLETTCERFSTLARIAEESRPNSAESGSSRRAPRGNELSWQKGGTAFDHQEESHELNKSKSNESLRLQQFLSPMNATSENGDEQLPPLTEETVGETLPIAETKVLVASEWKVRHKEWQSALNEGSSPWRCRSRGENELPHSQNVGTENLCLATAIAGASGMGGNDSKALVCSSVVGEFVNTLANDSATFDSKLPPPSEENQCDTISNWKPNLPRRSLGKDVLAPKLQHSSDDTSTSPRSPVVRITSPEASINTPVAVSRKSPKATPQKADKKLAFQPQVEIEEKGKQENDGREDSGASPWLRKLASAVFASHPNADVAFDAFDIDGKGKVAIREFKAGCEALFPVRFEGNVNDAFEELDEAGNGFLMRKQFHALAKILDDMLQEDDFIYIDDEDFTKKNFDARKRKSLAQSSISSLPVMTDVEKAKPDGGDRIPSLGKDMLLLRGSQTTSLPCLFRHTFGSWGQVDMGFPRDSRLPFATAETYRPLRGQVFLSGTDGFAGKAKFAALKNSSGGFGRRCSDSDHRSYALQLSGRLQTTSSCPRLQAVCR